MRVTMAMRAAMVRVVVGGCGAAALALVFGLAPAAHAATLNPKVLPNVEAATFEVVAAKPMHDPLSYAKPLPKNLLPYQRRTDKYYSVGTAFCIGPNRYVTAGHVMRLGLGSLWGPPMLRDSKGHVYAIGKILKFSLRRDFVVFTLKDPPKDEAQLAVDTHPKLNTRVYAVGNALGTGVVIRGGLYTSNTPENQDGAWKWIRFSAAASPGNSGGPLLDQDGKVIGVVLMKSPDENLNYALPMSEVLNAPKDMAVINRRASYQFDLITDTRPDEFKAQFKLPLSQAAFYQKFLALRHADVEHQLKALLTSNAKTMFPNGKGSEHLLYGLQMGGTFPAFLVRKRSGRWVLDSGVARTAHLQDNGYINLGNVGSNIVFHVRKPDSLPASKLYGDPAELMNLMAKAGFMTRTMGGVKDQITSLGKPTLDITHLDKWHRRWRVREWPMPYSNSIVIVLDLPVPNGVVGFMRGAPAAHEHDFRINLLAMTDYFQVPYSGTLKQWQAFRKHEQWLPPAFKDIHFDIAYGKHFSYSSPRVSFTVPSNVQKVKPGNILTVWMSFYRDHGKVIHGVSDVQLDLDQHDNGSILVVRHPSAAGDPDQDYQHQWKEITGRQHPYDAQARNDSDVMKITTVVPDKGAKDPPLLYTLDYYVEGNKPQKFMQAKLDTLLKGVQVHEY